MNLNELTLEIGMHMPFLIWKADFVAKGNDFNEHGHVNITFGKYAKKIFSLKIYT